MGEIADYKIERALAEEPDLACFEARHVILPRRAHLTVATAPTAAARMMREACALESLRHPGVPRVFDCGVVADGLPWVARELVIGNRYGTSLAARDVAELVRDVAEILAHAHARGIVHGDVWIDAIVNADGMTKLTSWKHARTDAAAAAPEDIYALGVAAYAMLPREAPRELAELINDMIASDDGARPTAAEVSAAAGRLAEAPDDLIGEAEEVALIVDLSRDGVSGLWESPG